MRALIILIAAALVRAQAPAPRPFSVVRLDPALDAIISTVPNSKSWASTSG